MEAASSTKTTRSVQRIIGDADGVASGPTLVIIGGLHGNELAGIQAAERVYAAIDRQSLQLRAGRLVALRGNLVALSVVSSSGHRKRYVDEDLNRAFVDDPIDPSSIEQREREELTTCLERLVREATGAVHLLDLHTVSSESPAFVALEDSLPARRFASCFPLPKVLGMEEELSGLLIDYATTSLGCISCIAEAGQHDDPHAIDVHESLILIALETLRMVTPDALTSKRERPRDVASDASGSRAGRYYDVRERVPIRDTSFEMQPNASAFQPVAARRTVVARERLLPRTTDHSGLLFLPNRQLSRRVGDDGFFVIAHVGQVWLGLSAWLRRRQSLHHWLPRVLPGVRRRDGDPHALLIAPEYAAVLRRETLHLLGYRLTRWSHIPYMPSYQRIWTTAVDIVRSVSGIIAGVFRGGERRALPEERDTDWIARRRVLDVSLPCAINATDPGQPKGMTP